MQRLLFNLFVATELHFDVLRETLQRFSNFVHLDLLLTLAYSLIFLSLFDEPFFKFFDIRLGEFFVVRNHLRQVKLKK